MFTLVLEFLIGVYCLKHVEDIPPPSSFRCWQRIISCKPVLSLKEVCLFALSSFKFSLILVFFSFTAMGLDVNFLYFTLLGNLWCFWNLWISVFHQLWKHFSYYLLKHFFHLILFSPSGTLMKLMLGSLSLFSKSLNFSLWIFFFVCLIHLLSFYLNYCIFHF